MQLTVKLGILVAGLLGVATGGGLPYLEYGRSWWERALKLSTIEVNANPAARPVGIVRQAPEQDRCTTEKIWLDIFFLIDASSAMRFHRMDNAVAYILSILYKMTIGRDTAKMLKTRVGFVRFASQPQLLYNLTHFESTDDVIYGAEVYYDGSEGANVKAAIRLAAANFRTVEHRPDVQKLIVILASAENDPFFTEAEREATKFKENGGKIITIEYSPSNCTKDSHLGNLASKPSYVFSNCRGPLRAQKVRSAFCDVNRFCPRFTRAFENAANGCYRAVTMPAIQSIALRNCEQHDSTLPKIDSLSRAKFLFQLMPWRTSFWIGLQREDGVFKWRDRTELNQRDYQMWAAGYPKRSEGDCVFQEQSSSANITWKNGDCDNDLDYVCRARPCDTDHYCGILPQEETSTTQTSSTPETGSTSLEPVTSTEVPMTSTLETVTTTGVSMTSISKPLTTTVIPTTSTSMLVTTTELPVTSTSRPVTTTEESITSTLQTTTTIEESTTTTSKTLSTTEVPMTSTLETVTTTEVPVTSTSMPVITTEILGTSTSKPVTTTEESITSTLQTITNMEESTTTTSKPLSSTEAPTMSSSKPVTTTEGSITSSSKLVTTAEVSLTSTSKPVTTTEESTITTSKPARTTEELMTTISKQITTTEEPMTMTTTSEPGTTTEESMTTTSRKATTAQESMTTTSKSATTTEEFTTTSPMTTTGVRTAEETMKTTKERTIMDNRSN